MAKETVQAVRQAELNAVQKLRDAQQKKEAIISEAEQNARALITSMTKQALDKAQQDLIAINQSSNEMLEAAKIKADNEVLILKEMAERKEEAALHLVLSSVIQNNS